MKLDILSIGDELLIGQTLNTNAHWLSKELNLIGFQIRQHTTVSDEEIAIISALNEALGNSDVVIITGGLGPTKDDLTLNILTKYFGGKLIMNEDVYQDIEKMVTGRGYEMNELNRQQALVPDNAKVLRNKNGTAPGTWFEKDGKIVVSMPGVPYEMKAMTSNTVIPWLKEKIELPVIVHKMIYTQGIPESQLAEKLEDWENNLPNTIKLAYLPSPGRVKLRLSSIGNNRQEIEATINKEIEKVKTIIGKNIFSLTEDELQVVIGDLLRKENATLSTAESCTGGYIAHLITQVSGASDYFKGAVVSYANETKIESLGVNADDINQYGAVSKQIVEQMAIGVRTKLNTNYSIATSGVAGPSGGTDEKPVGTVWIAVASEDGVVSKTFQFGKDRAINIERSAIAALGMLRSLIIQ
ncbi:MAG: competence/damage-inducible protein A [Flavobacteriales bacterium]|nr:competence/damage-inducible protein A [Flavobacteriales bacterium]MCW8912999.1 competence/damage-inducible protein A [Flavobacteriales bacterium]MCW8938599.1 competence/damage-inducible protein A [Flavobacteriales bacterium]MCW8940771.1 competence/damage-inducible protein A [Flavobacteriales bacterium]MCW8967488.1 competence/damage-inducible protein A [Flavobacteriales bacterium]